MGFPAAEFILLIVYLSFYFKLFAGNMVVNKRNSICFSSGEIINIILSDYSKNLKYKPRI